MAVFGYDWDVHTTNTEDGWELTLFHVTGQNGQPLPERTQPPVIMQHAMGSTADLMALSPAPGSEEGKAVSMQLVDRGFDLWFTNNRATVYSPKYAKAEAWEKAYWDFSFDDYGKYDNVANMKYIYDFTGGKKVSYYGYSLGTTQGFYSLARLEESFFAEHAQAFALVAPCTISEFALWPLFNRVFMTIFETLDVYGFAGKYWYQDLPVLCKHFGA